MVVFYFIQFFYLWKFYKQMMIIYGKGNVINVVIQIEICFFFVFNVVYDFECKNYW